MKEINNKIKNLGLKKNEYDVIIIGAGIGGLVCGCYLSKAGWKVLIVEQHHKVGGYCTSFKRKGFTFDAGIRGFVGCNEEGPLGKVIKDLLLYEKIKIIRQSTFDVFQFPDFEIALDCNYKNTLRDLQKLFPHERKNIAKFFTLLTSNEHFSWIGKLKNISFYELISEYFKDEKLIYFWNTLRADIGLDPKLTPALPGFILCRGYIMDGGYYPMGGMQAFSNCLGDKFCELGGELFLSKKVDKILLKMGKVRSIETSDKEIYNSKVVVANCDATQTYSSLIGKENLPSLFLRELEKKVTSISVFAVFLGLNKSYKNIIKDCCSIWKFKRYLKDNEFNFINNFDKSGSYVICSMPSLHDASLAPKNCETIFLYAGVPYKSHKFWNENKERFSNKLINTASEIVPNLKENIIYKNIATPYSFYRYTLNRNGASRGWLSNYEQTKESFLNEKSFIDGLYFASHWTNSYIGHGGIALVANTGKYVAKKIIKNRIS